MTFHRDPSSHDASKHYRRIGDIFKPNHASSSLQIDSGSSVYLLSNLLVVYRGVPLHVGQWMLSEDPACVERVG